MSEKTVTNDTQNAKFVTGNLTRHIVNASVTSGIGFIALFVVDLIDMLFISMLGVDELAAAVGFAGAVLFVTTSISIGMAIAGGALMARALGEGKVNRATEVLSHVLLVGIFFAIGFATLVFNYLQELTGLIGATGLTQDMAIAYLRILIPTMPILMVGIIASSALRSHGATTLSMVVTLIGGAVNAVLDPIFIFTLDMGLEGAAWASVISRVALAATGIWYLQRRFGGFCGLSPQAIIKDLQPIFAIALPAMLANVAAPIGGAYVTRAAAEFGETAVAGMAVIGRVTPVAFAMIFSMSGAIGPIIGQNYGAKHYGRVRSAYNSSLMLVVVYVIPVVLVLYFLRPYIAQAFNADGIMLDLIFLFCGPLSLAWIFNGIIFNGNAAYNNLGHPFYSTWVNWGRNTLGTIPFVYVGAQIWGAEGVLIGQMAGGALVALASFILAERVMSKAERCEVKGTLQHGTHKHHSIFTMLNHRR